MGETARPLPAFLAMVGDSERPPGHLSLIVLEEMSSWVSGRPSGPQDRVS